MNPAQLHNIRFGHAEELLQSLLNDSDYSSIHCLVDENTKQHCLPLLVSIEFDSLIELESGEENKNLNSCEFIWNQLIHFGADRQALLVNLGGGVIGDMGGFAATCYKRGVDFIQIPTTLLAQVDASVGGKTGIDFGNIKNSIGLFQNPVTTIVDTRFLQTLPKRQFINGFAEVMKHALIADSNHLKQVENQLNNAGDLQHLVKRSVEIKRSIVSKDPLEKGLRKILNFGHSIGHAIESWSLINDADSLLHGEAIAVGMMCELFLSKEKTGLSEGDYVKATELIKTTFKEMNWPNDFDTNEILHFLKNDKKNNSGHLNFTLLSAIGKAEYDVRVSETEVRQAIEHYLQTC